MQSISGYNKFFYETEWPKNFLAGRAYTIF